MIGDANNCFSTDQAVTATALSENVIDCGVAKDLLGAGNPLFIVVTCVAAMTDDISNTTVAVTLETDSTAALDSAVVLATIGTFAAVSPIGTQLVYAIPPGLAWQQFCGLRYTVANGNLTTGTFTAEIVADVQTNNANKP